MDAGHAYTSIKGTIVTLAEENHRIRAVIDIGILVNMLMDKSEYRQHQLKINDSVAVYFNSERITVIE